MDTPKLRSDAYDRARVNGVELAYVEVGAGPPIVFVHGGLSDLTYLEPMVTEFAGQFRAIAYSRRYAWPNPPLPEGAADPVETQVSDLAGLLVGLRATPAHVVGHSWGGTVALLLAARHPQLVRTLTLIEPEAISLFVGSPPRLARVLRLFVTRPRTALTILRTASDALPIRAAYRRGDDEQAIRLALNWANGYDFSRELGPVDRLHVLANVGFSKAGALADPIKVTDEDTGRIKCPTLLVVGERSPEFFSAYVAELATLIKQAQVVVIPNATHGMISQNPQALSEAIRSFVSKQGAIVAS